MRTIQEFEIVDHGIQHEQYFQGCGLAFTEYDDIATGIGSNPAEAFQDALEQLAMADWETDGMENRIGREIGRNCLPVTPRTDVDECYYYASIRVK
jgi:hypothetical protein